MIRKDYWEFTQLKTLKLYLIGKNQKLSEHRQYQSNNYKALLGI